MIYGAFGKLNFYLMPLKATGGECVYYTNKKVKTTIPNIAEYNYVGVIVFEGQDRTIMLEQGKGYGLKPETVLKVLAEKNINVKIIN